MLVLLQLRILRATLAARSHFSHTVLRNSNCEQWGVGGGEKWKRTLVNMLFYALMFNRAF